MKLCLLSLTGFGNCVLKELLENPIVDEVMVYTRKEKGRFPHYPCEQLSDFCQRNKVCIHIGMKINSREFYEKIKDFQPDIILVATFDQKIPKRIIGIPNKGAINIHPSLLPKYRGPTPTNWTLINGEKESGVTFHLLSNDFDMGDILFQRKIPIKKHLTDGELRKRFAQLAGEMLEPFLSAYAEDKIQFRAQNKNDGSYYPRITSEEGIALLGSGRFSRDNIIRGLTPFPGIKILR
jgi:methionyl-tRNA formyltransferase